MSDAQFEQFDGFNVPSIVMDTNCIAVLTLAAHVEVEEDFDPLVNELSLRNGADTISGIRQGDWIVVVDQELSTVSAKAYRAIHDLAIKRTERVLNSTESRLIEHMAKAMDTAPRADDMWTYGGPQR